MPNVSPINLASLQIVLLGLFIAIAVIAGLARRLAISYPIVLVISGLLASFLPSVPRVPLPPDLVFLVFLPPLLFAAAWQTSWRDFKYNIVSIASLAVGLVFFTAVGVAVAAHYFMPDFDWRLGFLLGAVVAPTDAVAASSIAKKVGMPRRVVDILEGESLLNDATGLLALEFGVEMIVHGTTPTATVAVARLLWLFAGGIGVGLACGAIIAWLENWVDDGPVEIAISLIASYGAYLAAEEVRTSGVIAVVVCGLFLSRRSATFFSPTVRLQTNSVWDALEFLLNGLVFLLMGLQLPVVLTGIRGYSRMEVVVYGIGFSVLLITLRLLWTYPAAFAVYKIRRGLQHQPEQLPTGRSIFVVGWTGLRGVVALAAANSLPYTMADGTPFPQRNMIIFLTFTVILVTLVFQGLTLPGLVRVLGLAAEKPDGCDEGEARRLLIRRAMHHLRTCRAGEDASLQHAYDDLLHQYEHRMESILDCGPGIPAQDLHARSMATIMLETVQAEREELIELRETGRVDEGIYRTLERELDLSATRLSPGA